MQAPKPPGSSTEISPPAAVFEIAPAKVLHGAVRLHGLASSPTPDTHVLVACACASVLQASKTTNTASMLNSDFILVIVLSFTFQAIELEIIIPMIRLSSAALISTT
jgi:hypothetical protein